MATPIDIIAPQRSVRAPDGAFGASGFGGEWHDVYDAKEWRFDRFALGAETAPVTPLQTYVETQARRIQWLVVPPPGVTDYTVVIGRWVQAPANAKTKGVQVAMWVPELTRAGNGTAPMLAYQRNERDPVACYISAVVGAPAAPVPGVSKPHNAGFVVPDAFVVMHRPATAA